MTGTDAGAPGAAAARVERWLERLRARHLAELEPAEVGRALRALSSLYVERRGRIAGGAALEGRGKRAAFALYYGPLHFFLVEAVVRALGAAAAEPRGVLDLGCGTGTAGAAWALAATAPVRVEGVDQSGWAVDEARATYRALGVDGSARRGNLADPALLAAPRDVIAAFAANELAPAVRATLLAGLLAAARRGSRVLVVEPLARAHLDWWPEWSQAFIAAGGRVDEWRFPARLPDLLRDLARRAGLEPRELGARTLFVWPRVPADDQQFGQAGLSRLHPGS